MPPKSEIKRPMNTYLLFAKKERSFVQSSNPHLGSKDVISILGSMWRAMSDAEKAPYKQQAEYDQAQYKAHKQTYKRKTD